MSSVEKKGKKRTKSFYRKSAYGGKRPCGGHRNVLEPGIKGFLVMCNSNENIAVKECYNILNEYADRIYGQEQVASEPFSSRTGSSDESECEDAELAVKKEINIIKKTATSTQKRFQNVMSKAKNCVFIRTTVEDPILVTVSIMEDIAQHGLKKARYAARILPIIGTCKAHTSDIEKLAKDVLFPIFSQENKTVPSSYTVQFKVRNNNANTCSRTSVVPALTKVVSEINPSITFSWSDFEVAVLVEVVCTVCCLGVAPGYIRLRKYNLHELVQGPRSTGTETCEIKVSDVKNSNVEEESGNVGNDTIAPTISQKVDADITDKLIHNPSSESPDPAKICELKSVSTDEQLQQTDIVTSVSTDEQLQQTDIVTYLEESHTRVSGNSISSGTETSYTKASAVSTDASHSLNKVELRPICEDPDVPAIDQVFQ